MESQTAPVAFLGIGLMGDPMAKRLLAAGREVRVWNRTPAKAHELSEAGARAAATPAEAARGARIVIMMLANGPVVEEVLFAQQTASALSRGAIVVDMSSIPPGQARSHAAKLAELGVYHLDAPVSGGTKGAVEGTLAIMAGGDAAVFERARDVLEILGRPTLVGPSGSGQLAKLANQAIVAVTIGAVAEALLLAAAGGADPAKVREALLGGFADSTILKQHGQRMLERNWLPGGKVETHVKDLKSIIAESEALHLSLPMVNGVSTLFEAALAHGLGSYDHSALLLELERTHPGIRVGDSPDQKPGSGNGR